MRAAVIIMLFVFMVRPLPGAAPDELFQQANEAYSREDYKGAAALYEDCLRQAQSAAAHYNLGNAYYKLGETGRAVLHNEKALAIEPAHAEARSNLDFIRQSGELPKLEETLLERFSAHLTPGAWRWLLATGFWGAMALILLPPLFGGSNAVTRLLLVFFITAALAAVPPLFHYHHKSKEGVVFKDDTPLRVAPAPDSPAAGYLQAGEIAAVEKSLSGFYFLAAAGGKSGWVKADEFGRIWE